MKGKVSSFRRGKHIQKPRHFILAVEGIDKREKTEKLMGKEVTWKSPSGKELKGKITSAHGNKGLVRAVFEIGLPGQAINDEVEIK